MFCVTLTSLVLLIKNNLFVEQPQIIIGLIAVILFVLAIILIVTTIRTLASKKNKTKEINA
jgi:carbon starvation protein